MLAELWDRIVYVTERSWALGEVRKWRLVLLAASCYLPCFYFLAGWVLVVGVSRQRKGC